MFQKKERKWNAAVYTTHTREWTTSGYYKHVTGIVMSLINPNLLVIFTISGTISGTFCPAVFPNSA